jgi:hypothetical protein
MYANTNGMKMLTMAIVRSVNSLLQLLAMVNELCKSAFEG